MDNDLERDAGLDDGEERFVFIDFRALSSEALRGLVEEFVTRQATDYGLVEASYDKKLDDVLRQLESGDARIVFDVEEERANIVHRDALVGLGQAGSERKKGAPTRE